MGYIQQLGVEGMKVGIICWEEEMVQWKRKRDKKFEGGLKLLNFIIYVYEIVK